ncbi:MAG: hypothetical protein DMH00_02435 [Acidobacteria bacterium]|nr:MAG: hypothetical protein DMH00_02435 [Acidobacteriota bacterium]
MKTLTIRQASEALGRAPATIRRYIKTGRLPAEKEKGKFGEEFRIGLENLEALGLVKGEILAEPSSPAPSSLTTRWAAELPAERTVPRDLYNELVMKHERLLVQYGMIRASGQKMLEARGELDMKDSLLAEREGEIREIRERSEKEIGFLQNHLRQAEIEIEDRNIEIALLQEKVRGLEMVAASAEAVRSFDEEVRSIREREDLTPSEAAAPSLPDIRKIDALQDWLNACQSEKDRRLLTVTVSAPGRGMRRTSSTCGLRGCPGREDAGSLGAAPFNDGLHSRPTALPRPSVSLRGGAVPANPVNQLLLGHSQSARGPKDVADSPHQRRPRQNRRNTARDRI